MSTFEKLRAPPINGPIVCGLQWLFSIFKIIGHWTTITLTFFRFSPLTTDFVVNHFDANRYFVTDDKGDKLHSFD